MTLYDLIPEIFADRYLADPGLRRRYRARLELVRAADLVLAISDATARRRASSISQIPDDRIVVVGAAASAHFVRPASRAEALRRARASQCRARAERFVLYTVGLDDRKNFHGLFRAWAKLAGGGAVDNGSS